MKTVIAHNVRYETDNQGIAYDVLSRDEFCSQLVNLGLVTCLQHAESAYDALVSGARLSEVENPGMISGSYGVEALDYAMQIEHMEETNTGMRFPLFDLPETEFEYLNVGDPYKRTLIDYGTELSKRRVVALDCWGNTQEIIETDMFLFYGIVDTL